MDYQKQSEELFSLAKGADLFINQYLQGYATYLVDGHLETSPIGGTQFTGWLSGKYLDLWGHAPRSDAIRTAVSTFKQKAKRHKYRVFTRVANTGPNVVWLDICDDEWQRIRVDGNGWTVQPSTMGPKFERSNSALPLCVPPHGGPHDFELLRKYLNLDTHQDWVLVSAWLIGALSPTGPYPLLVVQGPQGGAKSTLARVLRGLVDPNQAPTRELPHSNRDLLVSAMSSWVQAFDNIGGRLPDRTSDDFCRLATGAGFGTRKLYKDGAEFVMQAARPLLLNGLGDFVVQADLSDRCISIEVPAISRNKRRLESEFWRKYKVDEPLIMAGLLRILSSCLKGQASGIVPLNLPRMADFAAWISWAVPALPWSYQDFTDAQEAIKLDAALQTAQDSPLPQALNKLLNPIAGSRWSGTPTALLQEINAATCSDYQMRRHPSWPADAGWLSRRLRALQPILPQSTQIQVTFVRRVDRIIQLVRCRKSKINPGSASAKKS